MIDFRTITKEELEQLENQRKLELQGMIETQTDDEIINELRFNYGFIFFGYLLINIEDGVKLELRIVDLKGQFAERKIYLGYIGIEEEKRKRGIGNKYMRILTGLADKYQYDMALDVDTRFGTKKSVLRGFYRKHGFISEQGDKNSMFRPFKTC
jgi:ribosomal protein S18 acetylase RimI-like enzyme